jgi:hypothetical protein
VVIAKEEEWKRTAPLDEILTNELDGIIVHSASPTIKEL